MAASFFDLYFRPHGTPRAVLPFSARSVGHVCRAAGYKDRSAGAYAQIFWGIAGSTHFTINGRDVMLESGQVLVSPPGETRAWQGRTSPWIIRWLTLDGKLTRDILPALGLAPGLKEAGPCPEALFKELEDRIRNVSPDGERLASAAAYRILCRAAAEPKGLGEPRPLTDQCQALLDKNYSDPEVNIDWAARQLSANRSALSRLFIREKGVAPSHYLASVRMQKAMGLLRTTDIKLRAVAEECGFKDTGYFCRVFKKYLGQTPSVFRGA